MEQRPGAGRASNMPGLSRIGIAIDSQLLKQFDKAIEKRGYTNRSEAFRDLARDHLIRESSELPTTEIAGTLTLVYDHHHRLLSENLTALQHEFHHAIISAVHVHLDHDNCLEVLILRGQSKEVRHIADRLISTKGIKHGQLSVTTTDVAALETRKEK
jgi:CopG family nickel-responsive transcriptional regulator